MTRLPDAYAARGDGSAVITTDHRWFDTETGASTPTRPGTASASTAYAFATDGRTYLVVPFVAPGVAVGYLVDGPTGACNPMPSNGYPHAISGNGRYVLFGVNCARGGKYNFVQCDNWRWDRTTGSTSFVGPFGATVGTGIGDNGRVLVYAADQEHWMADDPGGRRSTLPSIVTGGGFPPSMSANGRYLLYFDFQPDGIDQYLVELDTGARRFLLTVDLSGPLARMYLSGDGSTR